MSKLKRIVLGGILSGIASITSGCYSFNKLSFDDHRYSGSSLPTQHMFERNECNERKHCNREPQIIDVIIEPIYRERNSLNEVVEERTIEYRFGNRVFERREKQ